MLALAADALFSEPLTEFLKVSFEFARDARRNGVENAVFDSVKQPSVRRLNLGEKIEIPDNAALMGKAMESLFSPVHASPLKQEQAPPQLQSASHAIVPL